MSGSPSVLADVNQSGSWWRALSQKSVPEKYE